MRKYKLGLVNTFLVSLMVAVSLFCWCGPARAEQEGDFIYEATAGQVQITGYTGPGGDVTIPNTLGGLLVTSIGDYAFNSCTNLTGISLPQGVTAIGNGAFQGCTGLTSINLPIGVASIGDLGFEGCSSLTIIRLPEGVTSIGDESFSGCTGLTSIYIPLGVTSISEWAFYGCTGLTSISLPTGVTSIGNRAFYHCTSLIDIDLKQGLTSVGDEAFEGCTGLSSIHIPDGVISIGYGAFQGCTNLASISLPEGVTSVSPHTFFQCTGLTSISIPDSVTSIGDYAIYSCRNLTNISIPQGVTSIGNVAFMDCSSLKSINIPAGVTSFGYRSFRGCAALTSINIPEGTTSIGSEAFMFCQSLTSIGIPAGVTSIGNWAFMGCTGLTNINIAAGNSSYTIINGMIFDKAGTILIVCPGGLTSICIPAGCTSIGDSAFAGCTGLNSISIPPGVTSVGWHAFYECSNLTTINIPPGVTSIGSGVFQGCVKLTNVSLPEGVTSIGQETFDWCFDLASINIPDSVTSIGHLAFNGCQNLTHINIPLGVTKLDQQAFYNCTGLTGIRFNSATTTIYDSPDTIPVSAKIIGNDPSNAKDYAAKYNRTFVVSGTLQSIAITTPAIKVYYNVGDTLDITGLVVTGTYSDDTQKIETVTVADVTGFDSSAPATSQTLTVTVAGRTTTYNIQIVDSDYTFTVTDGAAEITQFTGDGGVVSVPNILGGVPVTSIGDSAFANCTDLTSISLPEGIVSIGAQAFDGCTNLATIRINSAAATIYDNADTIPVAATIIGNNPSTSKDYAAKYYRTFAVVGGLQSISITTPASKTIYTVGEALDILGLVITGTYSDTSTQMETITSANVTGFDSSKPAIDQVLTVMVGGKTITYKVQIAEAPVPSDYAYSITDGEAQITKYTGPGRIVAIPSMLGGAPVTGIGSYAFGECNKLISLSMPQTVTSIGEGAFFQCNGLTSVNLPPGLTSIPDQAFYKCSGLTSINIPEAVTSIGYWAFWGCTNLTSIGFPEGLNSIGFDAFCGCTGLTSVNLPQGATNIDSGVFSGCTGLTSVNLPPGLTYIPRWAFGGCTSLTSISIPQEATSIGFGSFWGCTGLTSIDIPSRVTMIDSNPFYGCDNLTSIVVDVDNLNYASLDGVLYDKVKTNLVICPAAVTSISIPEGVTRIGHEAFQGCTDLTSITLPQGITEIEYWSFLNCTGLNNVSIPYGVESIDSGAFQGCTGLTEINIPISVKYINPNAFQDCAALTSISIPPGVTDIGDDSFLGCNSLTNISVADNNLNYTSIDGLLLNKAGTTLITCPVGLTSIIIPPGVTSIGDNAFNGCKNLINISIPPRVATIGDNAFNGCLGLTSISIPRGVMSVGSHAFSDCSGLNTITFNSATTIFDHSESITVGYTIPATATIIGYDPSTAKDYAIKYDGKFEVIGTTVTLQSIAIATPAAKTKYAVGDSLDITGLVVTGLYSDGTEKVEIVTEAEVTGFDSSAPAASQRLTITIGSQMTTFNVQIEAAPVNTDYIYTVTDGKAKITKYTGIGGALLTPSTLGGASVTSIGANAFENCTGLTGISLQPGIENIGVNAFKGCTSLSSIRFDSAITTIPDDPETIPAIAKIIGYDPSTAKDYAAKYSRSFEVNNTPITLQSIAITTPAAKLNYTAGDTLDIIGLVVTGTYSDATTKIETVTSADVKGFDSSSPVGSQTLIITLGGRTTTYSIQIEAAPVIPDYVYTITAGKAQITKYTGAGGVVVTPVALGGFPVTSIGDNAFAGCKGLTSISLTEGIIRIGNYTFKDCQDLTSISLPPTLTSMGFSAFYNCQSLNSITLPTGLTSIGSGVFEDCTGLITMNIPPGVTRIGDKAFENCTGLTGINLPQGLQILGDNAFYGCSSLTSISLPQEMTSIGDDGFAYCSKLSAITIPQEVTSIGERAFYHCPGLTSIRFNSTNTIIGYGKDTIPDQAVIIGYDPSTAKDYAANYNRTFSTIDLVSIAITTPADKLIYNVDEPLDISGLIVTGTYGDGSTQVETITASNVIGFDSSEASEDQIITITVGSKTTTYSVQIIGTIVNEDYSYTIKAGEAQIKEYTGAGGAVTIPDTLGGFPVTSIGEYAFGDCESLTSVILPPGVISIGEVAFANCNNLTSISLPDGVADIGYAAFSGCDGLTSISLPPGVLSIGEDAFSYCYNLTSINIPKSVVSIGESAFAGCPNLPNIEVDPDNLYYCNIDGVLYNKAGTLLMACPGGVTSVDIPITVTIISNGAFEDGKITSITIPGGVINIGSNVFLGCNRLTSITVDVNNMVYASIDGLLFNKAGTRLIACPGGLTSISIPEGVTIIGDRAFADCYKLTNITIPSSVTIIGGGAFCGCYTLTSITIPSSVISIGAWAFGDCENLNSITFNSPTTSIYDEEYSNAGEYTIDSGATIIGHDPSTAKDYATKYGRAFQVIGVASNDATLSDLSVDGITLPDFDPATTIYNVVLPAGTTIVPTVTAAVNDIVGATAEVTPAASLPGTTTILVTAADGVTTLTYTINFSVVLLVTVTPASPNVNVDDTPLQITVPADVNNASLTTTPVNGVVTIPQVTVQSSTAQGNVDLSIEGGTEVTGPNDWDGTINLPQVVDPGSVTVTPENGYEASVSGAIEIGITDSGLTFSQPVRILLAGQGGKKAGRILNETFSPITYVMPSDTAEALEINSDGYLTVGSDLVIWTTHFTTFVAYTETPLSGYTLSGQVLVEGDDLTEGQLHYSGGATIELKQGEEIKYSTISSAAEDLTSNGSFSISGIAAGDYTVVISKAGYLTRSFALTINSDLTLSTTSSVYDNRIYLWAGDIVSDDYHVIAAADVNYILSKFNSDSTQVGFDPQVDIVKDQYDVISAMDVNLMLSNFNKNSTQYPADIVY